MSGDGSASMRLQRGAPNDIRFPWPIVKRVALAGHRDARDHPF